MFELQRHGDVFLRYYGKDYGVLSHRRGGRIGLQGDLLRVVREVESAIGLGKLLALPETEECPPRLAPVQRVLAQLLDHIETRPAASYSHLVQTLAGFYEHVVEQRHPIFAMLEVTYRCNLRCRHCYILNKVEQARPETMEEEQALGLLDSLADRGCLDVTLTGGETTLNPAWLRLVRRAKDLGLFTMLKTNGLTLTPKNAERYAEDPAHSTHLSLYGATAESHESLTRRPGSFARTLEILNRLAQLEVPCKVFCLVWKGNLDEVESMCKLIEDLGHHAVLSSTLYGRMDGDLGPRELRISTEDNDRLVRRGLLPPFDVAPCTAGHTKVKIEPTGRLATCELLKPTFGRSGSTDLAGWDHPKLRAFSERMIEISCSEKENGLPVLSCPGLNALCTGSVRGRTTFDL